MPENENELLWQASEKQLTDSNLNSFVSFINKRYQLSHSVSDYPALHEWSINHRELFWEACWHYFGILHETPYKHVLENTSDIKNSRWFSGATLNFSQNLIELNLVNPNKIALKEYNESGFFQSFTYQELMERSQALAIFLRQEGIKQGDCIAACVSNCSESIIAMLACSSIGAIWSSCSPDFGVNGMLDRFKQIEPVALFASQSYQYNGKYFDIRNNIKELTQKLTTVKQLILFEEKFEDSNGKNIDRKQFSNSIKVSSLNEASSLHIANKDFSYQQLPFNHPLYIMFSSGTTGVPKCIVHCAGGTLIQHLKEHQLHCDLKPEDTLFYFTTCGWMMWNWLISGLASKATLILYDGSPFSPSPEILFDIAQKENISHLGLGAKFISSVEKHGLKPIEKFSLEKLRCLLSTGSPLSHESFDFVYNSIKKDLCLSSISGGTDIISCFVLGNPTLPVYKGEIQCKGLGMDVDVYDENGNSIKQQKGELVCKQSFPTIPLGFWNDADGEKFHKAYFQQFNNCWAHGDYAEITENNGFIIHGRSDAVLNPGGVRIGTAEIYRQVEKIDEVLESVVIGQNWEDDVRVILFVVLRNGITLDKKLISGIKKSIRENATPRHVPSLIFQVADIPRTKSGKIVELAVREIVNGGHVKNIESLANPEALEYFRALAGK